MNTTNHIENMLIGNQANNKELNNKLNKLISILREKAALAIAFSGGVDSTFLLKVAQDTLKDNVIAVTAKWPIHSEREFKEAVDFVKQLGDIARIEVSAEERSNFFNPGFMDEVHYKLKQYGFKYITLDLMGYRTGSLNDGVKK